MTGVGSDSSNKVSRMSLRRICHENDVKNGAARSFEFLRDGVKREGILVRDKESLVAFENVCRHIPISLDGGTGDFLTPDGRQLICHGHGAVFETSTGLCIRGPCAGLALKKIPVTLRNTEVWIEED